MAYILRNKDVVDHEINELGITVEAGSDYVYDEGDIHCRELENLIRDQVIVFVDENGQEYTPEKTLSIYNAVTKPIYDAVYLKEEVDQMFADLVGSASSALDTLNELAAALGNDPNFATTITNELANKADKDHVHPYAPEIHDHDDRYNTKDQIKTLLALKSNIGHDHDRDYAKVDHNHDNKYSLKDHNHDGVYVKPSELPVHGQDYHYAVSQPVTTTIRLATKLTMPVTIHTTGIYRLGWHYMWNHDSTGYDFIAYILHNNGTIVEHRQEPKDSAGKFGNTGTDQKVPATGFMIFKMEAGEHTFLLRFGSSNKRYKSSMWNAHFEFWRVE